MMLVDSNFELWLPTSISKKLENAEFLAWKTNIWNLKKELKGNVEAQALVSGKKKYTCVLKPSDPFPCQFGKLSPHFPAHSHEAFPIFQSSY